MLIEVEIIAMNNYVVRCKKAAGSSRLKFKVARIGKMEGLPGSTLEFANNDKKLVLLIIKSTGISSLSSLLLSACTLYRVAKQKAHTFIF